jgi:hypothetical protein
MGAPKGNHNHLGHTHTLESRNKMSATKTGKHYSPATEFKKGMIAPMKGRIMSEATKQKISLAKQGQTPWNKGLGTKSSENEKARKTKQARDWRKAIFERDDYTCQLCNERGGELNADHIQPFAYFKELRYELTNGRTLCVDCHRSTKTWGFHATNGVFNLA